MKIIVLYHGSCADGSMAAAVTALAHTMDEVHFMSLNYVPNDGPIVDADGLSLELRPDLWQYDSMIIVDFSLTEQQLALFTKKYKSNLVVLDHHNVRQHSIYDEACTAIGVQPSSNMHFNAAGSGTLLAYMKQLTKFSSGGERVAMFLGHLIEISQLVSDRDIWVRSNVRAFEFYEGYAPEVFSDIEKTGVLYTELPSTVSKCRNIIRKGNVEQLVQEGRARIVKRDATIKELIVTSAIFSKGNDFIQVPHVVVSAERAIRPEVGQYVFDHYPEYSLALMFSYGRDDRADTVFVSVRSRPNYSYSAKKLSMDKGGNGHENAAGFQIPKSEFDAHYSIFSEVAVA